MADADPVLVVQAAHVLQLTLGMVFLLAAVPKLAKPGAFVRTVLDYRLLPVAVARKVALGLIAVESFLAIALLEGWHTAVALPVAMATLLGFLAAVVTNLRRGRRVRCGCFGDAGQELSARTLIRLSMLLGAAGLLAILGPAAGTPVLSIGDLLAGGWMGLRYGLELSAVAGFLILAALWLLQVPELASLVRGPARSPHDAGPRQDAEAM